MPNVVQESAGKRSLVNPDVRPALFAHVLFKTTRFKEMIRFYCDLLNAHQVMGNDFVSFLTYDDEHHRVAICKVDGLKRQDPGSAGLEHLAYTYRSLGDLLTNYLRLKKMGILPFWCINHGMTTSTYYRDPDGNSIELQADNYDTPEELNAFLATDAFHTNPIGVQFDPERLVERYLAGDSEVELKKQGSAPIPEGTGYFPQV